MKTLMIAMTLMVSQAFGAQFDTAKSELTPEGEAALEAVAETLKGQKIKKLTVEGHADQRGSEGFNQALSLARAKKAAQKLESVGVKVDEAVGKGKTQATGNNDKDRKVVTRVVLQEKVVVRKVVVKEKAHKNILSLFAQEVRGGLSRSVGASSAELSSSPEISPGIMYQRRLGDVYLGAMINTEKNVGVTVGLGF